MKAQGYTKETILNMGVSERNFPKFKAGDTIAVTVAFSDIEKKDKKEAKTVRNQIFEGLVIAIKNSGIAKTFTVRKIIDGISVERIFPYYSPNVLSIELKEEGRVRRARIYYMRERYGKNSIVKRKKKNNHIMPGNKVKLADMTLTTNAVEKAIVSSVSSESSHATKSL